MNNNHPVSKNEFVNLHSHSTFSLFDAIGYPQEHIDFAIENGSEALALTDHGNMSGFSYQFLHAKKLKEQGKRFKPIYGLEAYFVHSIPKWNELHERVKEFDKKLKSKEEEISGLFIEDENATKTMTKFDCLSLEENRLYRRSHLILLAQNQKGLNNLFTLISRSYRPENFFRFPRMDLEMLREHNEGLIISQACAGGLLSNDYWTYRSEGWDAVQETMKQTISAFKEVFEDRFYGELQWNRMPEQHEINQHQIALKDEMDLKLISTADAHFPRPELWQDRELYKRLRPGLGEKSGDLPQSIDELGYELYPKNAEQMWDSFCRYSKLNGETYNTKDILESFKNTTDIAFNKIEDFEPDTSVRLPSFVVSKGKTAEEEFEEKCWEGLKEKGLDKNQVYVEQLKEEIKVITERGFASYFLTMKAIVDEAWKEHLVGPGRGSAAGALVSYVLNITQIDPLSYGLLFSRFMRSDQTDYPDIDTDFSNPMKLKDELIKKWGDDVVAPISNWNKLSLKSLIKDVSKFHGIPFTKVNEITGKMLFEATPHIKKERALKAGVVNDPTLDEVERNSPSLQNYFKEHPEVQKHLKNLLKQIKSNSRHAGGLAISEKLNERMPLIYSGGVRQTPWSEGLNVKHLEPLGFIKFDVLGLATLEMFEDTIIAILRKSGAKKPTFDEMKLWYKENLCPDVLDLNDQFVYENIFHEGKFAGVFQFTENWAQSFCKKAKPKSIVEIATITSLLRPGPMSAGAHTDYLKVQNGQKEPKFYCKEHEELTRETNGFLIFQEQIAQITSALGKNITLEDGSKLEKLLRKKRQKALENPFVQELRQKFEDGCVEKGMTKKDVEELFESMVNFAQYGFNKSHAVCYSIISYQCAYLLTYCPDQWIASYLNKETADPKKREKALGVAKSLGYKIEPADINESERVWRVSEDKEKTLIEPFLNVKGLGEKAIDEIYKARPFETIEEVLFNENISYRAFNKKSIDALCRSGAMKSLQDERFFGDKHFWKAVADDKPKTSKKLAENIEKYKNEGSFSRDELISFSLELSGQFPISLVLTEKTRNALTKRGVYGITETTKSGYCWFILMREEVKTTKTGKGYLVLHVIDDSGKDKKIKCWGITHSDILIPNHAYLANLDYDDKYGFSVRGIKKNFRLIK